MKITRRHLRRIIRETVLELEEVENTCWDGYRPGAQSGKKTKISSKTGKRVNNCEKISEGLRYHIDRNTGVDRNIYRPGSESFFSLFREARSLYYEGSYIPHSRVEKELLESDIGTFGFYNGKPVPLDWPVWYEDLNEAEYKGRKVELNKPKRGGSKGAYVYVKNDKGNVVKVEFGSSMPDAMGKSEAHRKRRKSFGDRHQCAKKKDKTAPGYWACRSTKHFGRNISGWW